MYKAENVLNEYPLTVYQMRRGRRAYLCETDCGLKILKEYFGSEAHAQLQEAAAKCMQENGMVSDCPVRNTEGELLSVDRDGKKYMLQDWYDAPECDIRNREQLIKCVKTLAQLHLLFRQKKETLLVSAQTENYCPQVQEDALQYERHNRELKKVRSFARARKKKSAYELDFLSCCDAYIEQGEEMVSRWKSLSADEVQQDASELCHGDYNYHNLLMLPEKVAVCGMEQIGCGHQIFDLALFLRKVMEKHNYAINLGERLIYEYEQIAGMTQLQQKELYLYLLYPVKFWKIANHYYNSHKAWISKRDMAKQKNYMEQEKARQAFLRVMESEILHIP